MLKVSQKLSLTLLSLWVTLKNISFYPLSNQGVKENVSDIQPAIQTHYKPFKNKKSWLKSLKYKYFV